MEWNRTEILELAAVKCPHCQGSGLRVVEATGDSTACNCVLRGIFRQCYDRFVECTYDRIEDARSSLEHAQSSELPGSWCRKNEEYSADFLLVAKRTLTEEEHKIFRFRYLLGADWRLCCLRLKMEKGAFHHTCYRIQQKLGRVFAELQPYALFPVAEYFTTGLRTRPVNKVVAIRPEASGAPKKNAIPLKKAA